VARGDFPDLMGRAYGRPGLRPDATV